MSFQGMDPQAVKAVADGLSAQAAALDQVVQEVDLLIRSALHVWPGPDAEDFHGWWVGQHRPRLGAAAHATQTGAASLAGQVASQLDASGEGAGGVTSGPLPGLLAGLLAGGAGLVNGTSGLRNLVGGMAAGASGAAYLATRQLVGRYAGSWGKTPDFFHWKKSGALHGIQGLINAHPGLAKMLPGIARNLGKVDGLLKPLGVVAAGFKAGDAVKALADGDYLNAGLDTASVGASGLKATPNPVAYLGGMAVEAWVQVGKEAQNVDWSTSGFGMTWNYMTQDPWGALGGAGDGLTKMPGILLEIVG